jgi:hypothetical protein
MDLQSLKDTPPWEWPEDAGKTLLATLRDRGQGGRQRLVAAKLAGEFSVIDDALAAALLEIVGRADEAEDLRGQAAASLGPALEGANATGFDDPEDVPISEATFVEIRATLQRLFKDEKLPDLVRRRILEAAVRSAQDWHVPAIRAAYQSTDPAWRLTAVFCMQHVRGFESEIVAALESPDEAIRFEAIQAAEAWAINAAWPRVAALASSDATEKGLRIEAIAAVAALRPGQAGALLRTLTDSEDEEIVEAAHDALAELEAQAEDSDEDDEGESF